MNHAEPVKLEPCPFCGGDAEIERFGTPRASTIYQCTQCGCSLETGEEWGHGRQWNRRPALSALVAERDALAAEIAKLREALTFYADKDNHKMRREPSYRDRFSQNMKPGRPKLGRVSEDKGRRARAALAQGGE